MDYTVTVGCGVLMWRQSGTHRIILTITAAIVRKLSTKLRVLKRSSVQFKKYVKELQRQQIVQTARCGWSEAVGLLPFQINILPSTFARNTQTQLPFRKHTA